MLGCQAPISWTHVLSGIHLTPCLPALKSCQQRISRRFCGHLIVCHCSRRAAQILPSWPGHSSRFAWASSTHDVGRKLFLCFFPGAVSFLSEAAHSGVQQPQGKRQESRAGRERRRIGRRRRTFCLLPGSQENAGGLALASNFLGPVSVFDTGILAPGSFTPSGWVEKGCSGVPCGRSSVWLLLWWSWSLGPAGLIPVQSSPWHWPKSQPPALCFPMGEDRCPSLSLLLLATNHNVLCDGKERRLQCLQPSSKTPLTSSSLRQAASHFQLGSHVPHAHPWANPFTIPSPLYIIRPQAPMTCNSDYGNLRSQLPPPNASSLWVYCH